MNDLSPRPLWWTGARTFLASAWPRALATDSESQRRNKLAVRSAQLAVAALVVAAVVGGIVGDWQLPGRV